MVFLIILITLLYPLKEGIITQHNTFEKTFICGNYEFVACCRPWVVAKNFSRHDIFRASSIGTPIFASQVSYYSFLDLNIDL